MLDGPMTTASDFGARKIFLMLFLMIGPIKILVPFVEMTRGADRAFRRTLARRAILFSAAALALAGVLGRSMLENFEISLPVLALTGGLVLFLVALRTVLQQSAGIPTSASLAAQPPDLKSAFAPLAFPTIVTPYGIAAVIVFATLAADREGAEFTVAGIVLLILALDWVAMLFAETILRRIGDRASGVCRRARRHPDRARPAGNSAQPVHDRRPCRMQELGRQLVIRDAIMTRRRAKDPRDDKRASFAQVPPGVF